MNAIGFAARQVDGNRIAERLGLFQSIGRMVIRRRLVGDLHLRQSAVRRSYGRRRVHPTPRRRLPNGETGIYAPRHWPADGQMLETGTTSKTDVQSTDRITRRLYGGDRR